jgi:hypothetical protein
MATSGLTVDPASIASGTVAVLPSIGWPPTKAMRKVPRRSKISNARTRDSLPACR